VCVIVVLSIFLKNRYALFDFKGLKLSHSHFLVAKNDEGHEQPISFLNKAPSDVEMKYNIRKIKLTPWTKL
jgi:hypothetical protein